LFQIAPGLGNIERTPATNEGGKYRKDIPTAEQDWFNRPILSRGSVPR
jgi:hypothetical protein